MPTRVRETIEDSTEHCNHIPAYLNNSGRKIAIVFFKSSTRNQVISLTYTCIHNKKKVLASADFIK